MTLSVIIIAKNEAANIQRCLQSVQWAHEIIVLDSGSVDDTVAIAKRFTPHVYCTDWLGYGIQKQRALSHATGDWILNLDADEVVSARLQKVIQKAILQTNCDAYRVPIMMHFYGKPLRFSSSPKRHVRLFKRKGAKFSSDIVHEKICLPKESHIGQLKAAIEHHSFKDVSHALYKLNKYSSYSAKIRMAEQKAPSMGRAVLASIWMFLRCYVLQGGALDGKIGLLFAALNAQAAFYRSVKQIYHDIQGEQLPHLVRDVE